jgi:hypothetical protein
MAASYTDDVPQSQRVKTSTRLWSQECAMADASGAMDFAGAGESGLQRLVEERQSVAYEFSNGRTFLAKRDPYA